MTIAELRRAIQEHCDPGALGRFETELAQTDVNDHDSLWSCLTGWASGVAVIREMKEAA